MIRKTTTLLVLALFFALPASAQLLPGFNSVGVKGGVTFSSFRGDFIENTQQVDLGYETGFVGGIYGQAEFLPFFTPRLEVLYVQKGAAADDIRDGSRPSLDYLEVPLLLRTNVPLSSSSVSPGIYAGPFVSFLLDDNSDELFDDSDANNEAQEFDDLGSTDYGVAFGADMNFNLGSLDLLLDVRYDLGLSDIGGDNVVNDNDEDLRITTGTWMVTLGVGL